MRTAIATLLIWICLVDAATVAFGQQMTQPVQFAVDVDQLFKPWDKNGDGKLSADEVPRPQLFKYLDKKGDGIVTKEEAASFLAHRGAPAQTQTQRGQEQKPGQPWRYPGTVQGAPLPPPENFQPRPHGEEAIAAGLIYRQPRPGVLEPVPDLADPTVKPTLFLDGHGMFSTILDYERVCRMILNRGELDGVRVLKPETVAPLFQNHVPAPGQKYGRGGAVDGEGGYGWGGAEGTQFWIDRANNLFAIFMTPTDWYQAPTYNVFRPLVFEAAGIAPRFRGAPRAGGAEQ